MSPILFAALVASCLAQGPEPNQKALYADIRAPQVVGVPPTYAVRDLCVMADGEIRHYGWKTVNGRKCRVYVASRDSGLSWKMFVADPHDVGAMVKSPWSGDWLYLAPHTLYSDSDSSSWRTLVVRSKKGPGDVSFTSSETGWVRQELRQIFPMKSRKRWIAAFSDVRCPGTECYHAAVAYSDDDGVTWTRVQVDPVKDVPRLHVGDRRPHWFNNGCEPTIVELNDGSLLMAVRTSGEHHAFYTSRDGGETWGEGREHPAFWAANTMPYLFRLSDGRLLFIWNNTAMLPTRDLSEYPELGKDEQTGRWEAVFTNRDALHAAISVDDGKTWKGFREIALNEIRNASDFRELGNSPDQEIDKSVHQTQALELADGKVLIAYGQNSSARRLAIFDPNWLLETSREDDFRHGLGGLSNHLYIRSMSGGFRGWAGHCAWNRLPGAVMVRDPETDNPPPGGRRSVRELLRLCRVRDPRLVSDRQGVVWNFPASTKGRVEIECRLEGEGFLLTLADHWMNPCDEIGPRRSPVSLELTARELSKDVWHRVAVAWDGVSARATLSVDGQVVLEKPLKSVPPFGLSYLHLQTLAEDEDLKGVCFRRFSKMECE